MQPPYHATIRAPGRRPDLGVPVRGELNRICVFALVVAAGWLLMLALDPGIWSREIAVGSAVAAGLLALVVVTLHQGGTILGIGGVYLAYLVLSHLGLMGLLLITDSPPSLATMPWWSVDWIDTPATAEAAVLSGLGICAMTMMLVRPWRPPNLLAPIRRTAASIGITRVGLFLLAVTGLYFGVAVATGALPLGRGYMAYREAKSLLPGYSLILVTLATGLTFLAATAERRHLAPALLLASVPAGILMLTGNRGDVLYPSVAAFAILARRGFHVSRRLWMSGLLALFVVIPVIRTTRTAERGAAIEQLEWSPDAVFMEIGFTLRPFVATVEWRADGEPLAMGRTYAIPVVRGVLRLLPFAERPSLENTPWDVANRLDGQGYTVIGEAFLNFGLAGVPLVMGLVGWLLSLAQRTRTDFGLARSGGMLAIGMDNIRNGFAFVPGQIVVVLALTAIGAWLGRRRVANRERNRGSVGG